MPVFITSDSTSVAKLNITYGDDVDFTFKSTWLTKSNATYYWQKDGVKITTGNKYRGTTTNILTLLNATEGDEGTYMLVEGHNSGLNSVTVSIGKNNGFDGV